MKWSIVFRNKASKKQNKDLFERHSLKRAKTDDDVVLNGVVHFISGTINNYFCIRMMLIKKQGTVRVYVVMRTTAFINSNVISLAISVWHWNFTYNQFLNFQRYYTTLILDTSALLFAIKYWTNYHKLNLLTINLQEYKILVKSLPENTKVNALITTRGALKCPPGYGEWVRYHTLNRENTTSFCTCTCTRTDSMIVLPTL